MSIETVSDAIAAIESAGLKVTGPNEPLTQEDLEELSNKYCDIRQDKWLLEENYDIGTDSKGVDKWSNIIAKYVGDHGWQRDMEEYYTQITKDELIEFARRVQLKAFW